MKLIAIILVLFTAWNALVLVDDGAREQCLNKHSVDYCVEELR